MSAERIHPSPTFWARQGLVDSLVGCVTGGESKKELDLEGDPFFELEVWFTPEQSPLFNAELPPEEELAERLRTAPQRLWRLVLGGLLTDTAFSQVMTENGLMAHWAHGGWSTEAVDAPRHSAAQLPASRVAE